MSTKHETLGLFPLQGVLFPGATLPLHVFEERYRRLVADLLAAESVFGVVLITRGSEVGGGEQRSDVGTYARIERAHPLPDGRFVLEARGVARFVVEHWLDDDPYPRAQVRDLPDAERSRTTPATLAEAVRVVRWTCALASESGRGGLLEPSLEEGIDPDELAWALCDAVPLGALDRQRLLSARNRTDRLVLLHTLCDELMGDLRRLLGGG